MSSSVRIASRRRTAAVHGDDVLISPNTDPVSLRHKQRDRHSLILLARDHAGRLTAVTDPTSVRMFHVRPLIFLAKRLGTCIVKRKSDDGGNTVGALSVKSNLRDNKIT